MNGAASRASLLDWLDFWGSFWSRLHGLPSMFGFYRNGLPSSKITSPYR